MLIQVVFQQGTTKLSVEKDKTSVVSDVGISFTDPRTQTTFFSTDFENHEFHLPKGVKVLSVKKASTERVCVRLMMPDSVIYYVSALRPVHKVGSVHNSESEALKSPQEHTELH